MWPTSSDLSIGNVGSKANHLTIVRLRATTDSERAQPNRVRREPSWGERCAKQRVRELAAGARTTPRQDHPQCAVSLRAAAWRAR
jgi:hypothetical protein